LSDPALTIVSAAMDRADEERDAPLFSRVGKSIEAGAIAHGVKKTLQVVEEAWTPHDARRTVATTMAEMGIEPHVIEALLNHISGFKAGVAGTYNRASYEPAKRSALERWGQYLQRLINGQEDDKVVWLKAVS
jgi:integrase